MDSSQHTQAQSFLYPSPAEHLLWAIPASRLGAHREERWDSPETRRFYLRLCSPHLSTLKAARDWVRVPENTAKARYDQRGRLAPSNPASSRSLRAPQKPEGELMEQHTLAGETSQQDVKGGALNHHGGQWDPTGHRRGQSDIPLTHRVTQGAQSQLPWQVDGSAQAQASDTQVGGWPGSGL